MKVKLVVIGGKQAGMEIPVKSPKFLIGRGDECHIRPQNKLVSRKHCAILVDENTVTVEDFGSTNGTLVNGERIQQQRELSNGDRLKIGPLELEVQLAANAGSEKKTPLPSLQQHAARRAGPAAGSDDELDISNWLDDLSDGQKADAPPAKPAAHQDTHAGKVMDDTQAMPVAQSPAKKNEPAPKLPGQFKQPPKPKAESSRAAAENMLRQFFPRKKP